MAPSKRKHPDALNWRPDSANGAIQSASAVMLHRGVNNLDYRLRDKLRDWFAGYRDRKRVSPRRHRRKAEPRVLPTDFTTDWIRRLQHEASSAQATDHLEASVAIRNLDRFISSTVFEREELEKELRATSSLLAEAEAIPADSVPAAAGEFFDSEEVLTRHRGEREARIAGLRSTGAGLQRQISEATQTIAQLNQVRAGVWGWLMTNVDVIDDFFNQRARTYARSATKRGKYHVSTAQVLLERPQWASAAIPEPIDLNMAVLMGRIDDVA